jgi:hypothetical protein
MFSKKVPKKVDQTTETRQMIRSSLINFSSPVFQSEENQMNNSLSSTQKIQSNLPFSNTLTSPLCRTPSIYQFSNSHMRESSANPGSSYKVRTEEESLGRRKSISYNPLEEKKENQFVGQQEEKKSESIEKAKLMSTESSVVMKNEKVEEELKFKKIHEKIFEDREKFYQGCEEIKLGEGRNQVVAERISDDGMTVVYADSDRDKEGLGEIAGDFRISENPVKIPDLKLPEVSTFNLKPDDFPVKVESSQEKNQYSENLPNPEENEKTIPNSNKSPIRESKTIENPFLETKEKSIPTHQTAFPLPSQNQVPPMKIIEIIEKPFTNPEKPSENLKVFPLPKPFISKEEPVLNLKTENFQIDTFLKNPEEPVFLKITQKSNKIEEIPEPDNESPVKPFLINDLQKIPSSNSPKLNSNLPKQSENLFESNIFLKEAAKKSFENLVNRISSDKKQLPNRLKIPEPEAGQNLEVPRKVDLKFKNSQEILRDLIKPAGPALALGSKLKKDSSLDSVIETLEENHLKVKQEIERQEKSLLSHSKSFSVNNTVIIHESREHPKRFSMIGKEFESSYSGKRFHFAQDSKDYPSPTNLLISPRNNIRRLPSLKISPIKSILSADDYSDILSFLKNSPHGSVTSHKKEPESNPMKKYKLPSLKPITPHYFHKKRSAPQLKQKARIMIEHL